MFKTLSVIITCSLALLVFACASTPPGNSASTNANAVNLDKANLPPGLSGSPLPVNGTTPGIPDPSQVNVNIKAGGTPTPGIDPANANKVPKGATPTPGIPSPAEIKKMMANGKQTLRMEANTPSAGNAALQQRDNMKQMQMRKKPE